MLRNGALISGATLRWCGCFVLVTAAHAGAAAGLLGFGNAPDDTTTTLAAPAIFLELAATPATPPQPSTQLAPGPTQSEQSSAATPAPQAPDLPIDIPKNPTTPDVVAAGPPMPREAPARPRRQRQAALTTAPNVIERTAPQAVAPAPGISRSTPGGLPTWIAEIAARLERYKRYPADARARGAEGTAQLSFAVDAGGRVHGARISRSSGSTILDHETLALIARAQPLPPPPNASSSARISVTVPIRYRIQ